MRTLYKSFFSLIISAIFTSCANNTDLKLKIYSDDLLLINDRADVLLMDTRLTMFIYYDSTACTTCAAKQLIAWNRFIDYVSSNDMLSIKFVFSPPKADIENFIGELQPYMVDYPVYFDTLGIVPISMCENGQYVCLINDDEVLLEGNPLYKGNLMEKYMQLINKYSIENEKN